MRVPLIAFIIYGLTAPAFAQTGTAYVPKAVPLDGTTANEASANTVWSLRAALNVAALQCQFSPFLRTVARYNALLGQHSGEFARAQTTLAAYFKRTGGKAAASAFDRYNTRLYQSYTTLDAQLGFCSAASDAGRDVLVQPIGKLGEIAPNEVAAVRSALTPVGEHWTPLAYMALPDLSADLICAPNDRRRDRC